MLLQVREHLGRWVMTYTPRSHRYGARAKERAKVISRIDLDPGLPWVVLERCNRFNRHAPIAPIAPVGLAVMADLAPVQQVSGTLDHSRHDGMPRSQLSSRLLLDSTSHDSDLLLDRSNAPLHDAITGTASNKAGLHDVPAAGRSCSNSSHLRYHRHVGKLVIRFHHDVSPARSQSLGNATTLLAIMCLWTWLAPRKPSASSTTALAPRALATSRLGGPHLQ